MANPYVDDFNSVDTSKWAGIDTSGGGAWWSGSGEGCLSVGTMSDDAVTIVYDNAPTHSQPPMCPHCGRDWHPGPLTADVEMMLRQHLFRSDYDPETDVSPIVCVGAEYHGPNRLGDFGTVVATQVVATALAAMNGYTQQLSENANAFSNAVSALAEMGEKIQVIFAEQFTIKLGAWLPPDEPSCADVPSDLHIEFGPENWVKQRPDPMLIDTVPYAVRRQLRKVQPESFPVPKSPGYDFTAYAKDIKYPTSEGVLK
jgi:hypothetical protein